jgi:hypothetical protein
VTSELHDFLMAFESKFNEVFVAIFLCMLYELICMHCMYLLVSYIWKILQSVLKSHSYVLDFPS